MQIKQAKQPYHQITITSHTRGLVTVPETSVHTRSRQIDEKKTGDSLGLQSSEATGGPGATAFTTFLTSDHDRLGVAAVQLHAVRRGDGSGSASDQGLHRSNMFVVGQTELAELQ